MIVGPVCPFINDHSFGLSGLVRSEAGSTVNFSRMTDIHRLYRKIFKDNGSKSRYDYWLSSPVFIAIVMDPDYAARAFFRQKPNAIKSILFHLFLTSGEFFTIQGNLLVDTSVQIFTSTCEFYLSFQNKVPHNFKNIYNSELRDL